VVCELISAAARRSLVLLLHGHEAVDRAAAARVEALLRAGDGVGQLLLVGACRPAAPGSPFRRSWR
jgi:hypothetical protein